MKKLLLFFAFFISLNTLAGPKYFKYDNGDVEVVQNFENNKREGNYLMVNKDKGDKEERTYKNGVFEGPYKYYFNDGSIGEGTYKNGEAEGLHTLYYENGQIRVEVTYRNGKLEGAYKEYYKNGQISVEKTYKNDEEEGPYKEYYENGKIKVEGTYKNGKLKIKRVERGRVGNYK